MTPRADVCTAMLAALGSPPEQRAAALVDEAVGALELDASVGVGGVLFERDADDLLDYMIELDDDINAFDADVATTPGLPALYVTAWSIYVSGHDDLGGVSPPVPGSVNWREYFDDNSGSWARSWRTDEIWQATADYETKLLLFRAKFRELGHEPKSKEPTAGPDTPPEIGETVGDALKVAAVIALIAAGGYVLHGVAAVRG